MNQNNDKDIDRLVELLDSQISQGTGHVNVFQTATLQEDEDVDNINLSSKKACACTSSACQVPTLLDISPDEN